MKCETPKCGNTATCKIKFYDSVVESVFCETCFKEIINEI